MKYLLITCAALLAFSAQAKDSESEHKKETIAQHQAIAAAHYAAAVSYTHLTLPTILLV